MLKERGFIFSVFAHCNKKSFETGTFAGCLEELNVTPIFKTRNPLVNKENYLPVSILLLPSKDFEKMIYKRLPSYIERILSPILYGSRKTQSTRYPICVTQQAGRNEKKCESAGRGWGVWRGVVWGSSGLP